MWNDASAAPNEDWTWVSVAASAVLRRRNTWWDSRQRTTLAVPDGGAARNRRRYEMADAGKLLSGEITKLLSLMSLLTRFFHFVSTSSLNRRCRNRPCQWCDQNSTLSRYQLHPLSPFFPSTKLVESLWTRCILLCFLGECIVISYTTTRVTIIVNCDRCCTLIINVGEFSSIFSSLFAHLKPLSGYTTGITLR